MTKLPVLDFHEIRLRSVGYIWHVFVIYDILTKTRTYLSLEFHVECFVFFLKKY